MADVTALPDSHEDPSTADAVDVRFEAPTDVADGRARLDRLKQRVGELQAKMAQVNDARPPRKQTINFDRWSAQRGRVKSALDRTLVEYRFVKDWLIEREHEHFDRDARPSDALFDIARHIRAMEALYVLVGDFLEADTDTAYDALVSHHERMRDSWEFLGRAE